MMMMMTMPVIMIMVVLATVSGMIMFTLRD